MQKLLSSLNLKRNAPDCSSKFTLIHEDDTNTDQENVPIYPNFKVAKKMQPILGTTKVKVYFAEFLMFLFQNMPEMA